MLAKPSSALRLALPQATHGRCRRIADVADRDRGRLNWAETGPTPVAREWAGFAHSDLPLIIGQDLSRRERGENPVLQRHQHLSGDW